MQPVALGQGDGVLIGGLEIVARFDEARAERRHRPVLLDAVAVRHDDRRAKAQTRCGKGDALPVIAAGRRHHAADLRLRAPDLVEIDEAAAQLEGADRGVVLVLDPQLGADPPRQ